MATTTLEQAFEIALDRCPSSAALARSYERFNTWRGQYESSSTHAAPLALQDMLSELPGVREGLLSAFSTLSFLLEQVYCNCPSRDPDISEALGDTAKVEAPQVEGEIALIERSVDTLFQISTLADEIDSEKDYAQALHWDLYPAESAYDSAHVLDRFSLSKAEDWLIRRLGLAISHRRCYLRFRSFQAQHSQHARTALAMFPEEANEWEHFGRTEIDIDVGEDTAKLIPRLENTRLGDGQVDCPCCQKRLRFTTESAWQSHFLADLRPYVCTSVDCSMRLFSSKTAWLSHEMEHLLDWYCPLCHDTKFQSYASYLEHVDKYHQDVEAQEQFDNLLDPVSKTRDRIAMADCPLCDWTKLDVSCRCLLEHIAIHLEELAIYAFQTKDATEQIQRISLHNTQVQRPMPELPPLLLTFLSSAITGAALLDASASRTMVHCKPTSRHTGNLGPQGHEIERVDGPLAESVEPTALSQPIPIEAFSRFTHFEPLQIPDFVPTPAPIESNSGMNELSRNPDYSNWDALYKSHSVLPASEESLSPKKVHVSTDVEQTRRSRLTSNTSHGCSTSPVSSRSPTSNNAMSSINPALSPGFYCLEPSCTSSFKRNADLQRHYQCVHDRQGAPLVDCVVQGCRRSGTHGFTRKDKMVEHVKEVHKVDLPKRRDTEGEVATSTYQRISITCGHCSRRKLKCLMAEDVSEQRCQNCIRFKKECVFYPVDQQAALDRLESLPRQSLKDTRSQPGVSFYFEILGMVPQPEHDTRLDWGGRWLPPKRRCANIIQIVPDGGSMGIPAHRTFYHDGTRTALLTNVAKRRAMRERARPFKTYSLYRSRGVVWTVDYEAIGHKVGDGRQEEHDYESETDSEDREGPWDDWTELSFESANADGLPSLSYAGRHLRERRLRTQGRDQLWVQRLLSDRYKSHLMSKDPRSGGLVGDLPLLVALLATSMPIREWETLIPQIMANPPEGKRSWRVSREQAEKMYDGSQSEDKKGVVVKVYLDPQGSSKEDLNDYEHGAYGPIFS